MPASNPSGAEHSSPSPHHGPVEHNGGTLTTHYDLLGVDADAPASQIKRAYYDKARLFHPDGFASAPAALRVEAERAMRDLNVAWSVLRNAAARHEYDSALSELAADQLRGHRRRRRWTREPHDEPRLAIGSGFRYWLGTTGAVLAADDGTPRFNLAVDGATDLAPLASLAPRGLFALHAQGSSVDDGQLKHLAAMSGLAVLDLSNTAITDAGLVHLQALHNLEVLMLWDTAVTDDGLALIRHLTSLRHLGLGNVAITDAGLAHLFGLQRLRLLQLWGTAVTGPGLVYLHRHSALEVVTLPWKVSRRDRRRLRRALPNAAIS